MAQERVQKILAQAGIASRRKAEELIAEGAVTINGKVAKLGDKAEYGVDAIKVNGKILHTQERKAYYIFYKPKNVISSLADPQGRPCIGEYLKRIKERVYPIGRLDFTSEGLILLTNDGDFAEQVQKGSKLPRFYEVKVKGFPDDEMLSRIRSGKRINNKLIRPVEVRVTKTLTSNSKVDIIFRGSGTLDIKELFEERGFAISRILRKAVGNITLGDMKPGDLLPFTADKAQQLVMYPELGLEAWKREADAQKTGIEIRQKRAIARDPNPRNAVVVKGTGSGPKITPRGESASTGFRPRPGREAREEKRPVTWSQKIKVRSKSE